MSAITTILAAGSLLLGATVVAGLAVAIMNTRSGAVEEPGLQSVAPTPAADTTSCAEVITIWVEVDGHVAR